LEHPLPAPEPQGLEIAGLGVRLRDGLSLPDRQRGILVRAVPHRVGYEQMARRFGERLEDGQVADSLRAQRLDQPRPIARERVARSAQSPGNHLRTTSMRL